MRTLLAALPLAVALVAPAVHAQRTGANSAASFAVYPPQRIDLRFDHRIHVRDLGMRCTSCHAAATSTRSSDRLLPPEAACRHCHAIDRNEPERAAYPPARCDTCHVGDPTRPATGTTGRTGLAAIPPPNLRFPHARHIRDRIECATCHGDVGARTIATRADLPTMQTCLSCHNDTAAPAACATCHPTEPDGVLRTRFASGTLTPPAWMRGADHGPDWIERHRWVAGDDSAMCASCHRERECTDCHDGRLRNRTVHPNDWITMHPVAAARNSPDCTSCHREQSFCIGCHRRVGVALSSPSAVRFGGRFHPPGSTWTEPPRGAGHHSFEAQRNARTCVGCHAEQDCVVCHGAAGSVLGGGRYSPHPASFYEECNRLMNRNPRPCRVCHGDLTAVRASGFCR